MSFATDEMSGAKAAGVPQANPTLLLTAPRRDDSRYHLSAVRASRERRQNVIRYSACRMYELRITTSIAAPLSRCFDLARSVDAHVQSAEGTGERVVGGRLSGLLELGDEVTWEARHFGVTQRLSSKITQFRPCTFFQDRMTRGAFRFLEHDHLFEPQGDGTLMTDVLRFKAPLGPLGWIAERVLLASHLRRFLIARGLALKSMAERVNPPEMTAE
jgi:ligand-binding SRPBCC domain-containing protein